MYNLNLILVLQEQWEMNNKHLKQKMNVNKMGWSPQNHQNIRSRVYKLNNNILSFHIWLLKKFVTPFSFFNKSRFLIRDSKIPSASKYFLNWNFNGSITPLTFFSSTVLMLFIRTSSMVLSKEIILGFS